MAEPEVGAGLDIQISRLAVQLAEDDLRELAALFAATKAAQPQLIWNPQPHQLPTPPMRALLALWEEAGGRRRGAIGPPDVDGALAPIREALVCLAADPADGLVYTHVGAQARALFDEDILGVPMSTVLGTNDTADIILYAAGYLACRIREVPLLTFNESRRGPLRAITRLVVPFWNAAGSVSGFATALAALERNTPG
ncbi:MAG: hypothetical protein JNK67_22485 [Alphaproteobacteria bacterium]|nr:hypothetical protein [Alphaproteobacteria bacterium]